MEEKKEKQTKKSKTVAMKAENPAQGKLSYEDLEALANNLNGQCKAMYQRLQEAERIISNFNDVGMLLSILKESEYFDEDFIRRCVDKIQSVVTYMLDTADESKKGE